MIGLIKCMILLNCVQLTFRISYDTKLSSYLLIEGFAMLSSIEYTQSFRVSITGNSNIIRLSSQGHKYNC